VFVGIFDGTIKFFRNNGTPSAPDFADQTGVTNPLAGVNVTNMAAPDAVDLDNDGDLDIVIGRSDGTLAYFRNNGTPSAPDFTNQAGVANPLAPYDAGDQSSPAMVDIDADGDQDAFVGTAAGNVRYFENLAVPDAPTGLLATAVSTTQIDLGWTDNSSLETSYVLERSPNGTDGWTTVATLLANTTSYSDVGLTPETTYFYRLRAVNGNFNSTDSAVASARTEAPPAPSYDAYLPLVVK
jgi:hypothetical protein